jgi:hypothetical protein
MTCYLCCRKFRDNGNYQFYDKAVNKTLQNGRLLVNDPFVGKLYHFAINHASDLCLNKKANYSANKVKICNCDTRCASRYRFI